MDRVETSICWTIAILLQPVALALMLLTCSGESIDYGSAKQVAARAQISAYVAALKTYKEVTGDYPSTREGLKALRTNPGIRRWGGPYVEKDISRDPWGNPYSYRYRAEGIPEVISFGLEGKPGPSNISSLTLTSPLPRTRRAVPFLRLAIFLVSALVFFGYPFLPRLLRKLNARMAAC